VLLRFGFEPEEQAPRPLAAGNAVRDSREGVVQRALELDAVLADDNSVLGAVPVAQQHGSRFESRRGCHLDGPSRRGIGGNLHQQPAGRRFQAAERYFLNPIGERELAGRG
jgi:hypothetical protein